MRNKIELKLKNKLNEEKHVFQRIIKGNFAGLLHVAFTNSHDRRKRSNNRNQMMDASEGAITAFSLTISLQKKKESIHLTIIQIHHCIFVFTRYSSVVLERSRTFAPGMGERKAEAEA